MFWLTTLGTRSTYMVSPKYITYTITDIGRKEYVETCILHTYRAFGPNVTVM